MRENEAQTDKQTQISMLHSKHQKQIGKWAKNVKWVSRKTISGPKKLYVEGQSKL